MKILLTGGGGAGSESLFKQLSDKYELYFADADKFARSPFIPLDRWLEIPYAKDTDFVSSLIEISTALAIDLIIPGVDEELTLFAKARNDFNCGILLPDLDFINLHLDKAKSNLFLKSHGIPVPQSVNYDEWKNLEFPIIAKPISGRGSRNVAFVDSKEKLDAHILLSGLNQTDYVLQEYLEGQEFTVTMVANKHGQLMAVVPVRVDIKRGITIRAGTEDDQEVIDACIKIHQTYPVAGCYNIQLMKSQDGECKPFEVNPRISTTYCLTLASGVDFIELYQMGYKDKIKLHTFNKNVKLQRTWFNSITTIPDSL